MSLFGTQQQLYFETMLCDIDLIYYSLIPLTVSVFVPDLSLPFRPTSMSPNPLKNSSSSLLNLSLERWKERSERTGSDSCVSTRVV
jgi:hypothetical protein